jgi:hypothetical protein
MSEEERARFLEEWKKVAPKIVFRASTPSGKEVKKECPLPAGLDPKKLELFIDCYVAPYRSISEALKQEKCKFSAEDEKKIKEFLSCAFSIPTELLKK